MALFGRSLLHVPFTINRFPPSTCPSFCSAGNWLCLYNCLWSRGEGGPPGPAGRLALFCAFAFRPPSRRPRPAWLRPQIGFVLPGPIECTIHHNSFSAKPLPFFLLRRELGLFGAFAPRPPVPRPWGSSHRRSRTPPRCPASGNWLCFAQPSFNRPPTTGYRLLSWAFSRLFLPPPNHKSQLMNHQSGGAPPRGRLSLYLCSVLHES